MSAVADVHWVFGHGVCGIGNDVVYVVIVDATP
jgi:hypothetical protein